jgi:hypothetical protein
VAGSPSSAPPSALKRFGNATNQQIRGNLQHAECRLEKESGHAQQVQLHTMEKKKAHISPDHKAARCVSFCFCSHILFHCIFWRFSAKGGSKCHLEP